MGLLDLFRARAGSPGALPSGSFTVDRNGALLASTIGSGFAPQNLQEISTLVLQTFAEARKADLPFSELNARFGALNLRAVEMRGGAMIFLSPRGEQGNRLKTKS